MNPSWTLLDRTAQAESGSYQTSPPCPNSQEIAAKHLRHDCVSSDFEYFEHDDSHRLFDVCITLLLPVASNAQMCIHEKITWKCSVSELGPDWQ